MKEKLFGVLQRVGRSFMLPIAILPVAGLLLGLGSTFTSETTLATYNLLGLLGPGTVPYFIFSVFSRCGGVIFDNLPLIFAIGVAIGMARRDREVAALAAAVSFLVMHAGISAMLGLTGGGEGLPEGSVATVLGIQTLQMGAFGGILVGLGVAALHNRFSNLQLPQALSFFGGTRFVPILSTLVFALVGILMFFVWQPIQGAINLLGLLVYRSGYFGTFLFGTIKRLLIPFGLHHVFYLPFWQTALGGTMEVAGNLVSGAQNIFFAQLADPTVTHFSTAGTWCFTGEFVLYIFGFPGAALAMYRCARPERKKQVGGLLLSAALTSILTGITEPLEFSFLFVAPVLFAVSSVFAGLAYMLCHILNITVGLTFSGGFLDLALFGILQGNAKTSWLLLLPLGAAFFGAYYFTFSFLIRKFQLKTPGREEEEQETRLYTKADYQARKEEGGEDPVSAAIVRGLGGADNVADVDCCATRLRCTVHDGAKVDPQLLKSTGAAGVIQKGQGVQVVYGPQVNLIKAKLEAHLASGAVPTQTPVPPAETGDREGTPEKRGKPLCTLILGSPFYGEAEPITACPDEAFAQKMMGDGAAVIPWEGVVTAPCDATVSMVFDTRHAIGLEVEERVELLIHVGINTVALKGEGFRALVAEGDRVKKGEKLLEFDLDFIRQNAPSTSSPVLFTTLEEHQRVRLLRTGRVGPGEDLLALEIYET